VNVKKHCSVAVSTEEITGQQWRDHPHLGGRWGEVAWWG